MSSDNNTPDTVTTSPDNNTPDTVTMARLEREKSGPWEAELSYGGEGDLHQHEKGCKKNPGHLNFVPVDRFNVNDLPPGYHDNKLVDLVRVISNRTVRLSLKYVSERRPETFPGTVKPYPCYRNRGSNLMRVGTGVVERIDTYPREFITDQACDCKECLSSGNRTRHFVRINIHTAAHVVFDEQEAAHTTCHLFFDRGGTPERCEGVVKLGGFSMGDSDVEEDTCLLIYVTHDMELVGRLAEKLRVPSGDETYSPTDSHYPVLYPLDPSRYEGDDIKTKKHGLILCWANLLIQNLTNMMVQRLEDRLTQELFDIRIKTLHGHMAGRLEYLDAGDFTRMEIQRFSGDLIQIFEHILEDKSADEMQGMKDNMIHKLADSLKQTLGAQIMTINLTETLTDEEMSSLTDDLTWALKDGIAHSLAGILTDRLTDITQKQRGHLTQTLTDIMKHRLTDSLNERLTNKKTYILIDTAHKLIDSVTQSLLDGLIKILIESLTHGLTRGLSSTVQYVLKYTKCTVKDNQQQQNVLTLSNKQTERMLNKITRIDSMTLKLIDHLQSFSPHLSLDTLLPSISRMLEDIMPEDVTDNLTQEVNGNIQVTIDRLIQILIDDMNHLLINSLTQRQTNSPLATNSNKVTKTEELEMTERLLTDLTIIVSHPHGCSKQVSVGFCTQRWDKSDKWKEYVYTTATCPGSSGAPLFVYDSDRYIDGFRWSEYLLHAGNFKENKELNYSCGNDFN